MHFPGAWQFCVLALAAYRVTRLLGWDDFPPVARARAWALGETWTRMEDNEPVAWSYRRPTLAHFVHCAFCLGWWVSLAEYGAWLVAPRWTLYVAVPFALGAVVGLLAKNLDA